MKPARYAVQGVTRVKERDTLVMRTTKPLSNDKWLTDLEVDELERCRADIKEDNALLRQANASVTQAQSEAERIQRRIRQNA